MAAVAYVCEPCHGWLGMEPQHCHGNSDRVMPGVLGGYRCSCRCTWENSDPAPSDANAPDQSRPLRPKSP